MKKRFILIILALFLVVGVIAGIKVLQIRTMIEHGGHSTPPPETVSSAIAQDEEWETTIQAVGSLEAVQGVMVASELSGRVTEITFEPGGRVKAGDLLVQIDIQTEKAQLEAAEASASLAKINFDRQAKLLDKKIVARSDYDTADATYKEAMAQVESIRATINKKTILAPFSGRLGIRLVNLGQIVKDGDPIVTLQRLEPIFVNFLLPQQELSRVKKGYTVRLTSNATGGRSITGTITTINPEIDSATRNFRLQATVANSDELLWPGMYAEVAVVLPEKKKVLVIPGTAVLYAPYSDSVFVIEEKKDAKTGKTGKVLRQQFVRLGERRGDFVAVDSGLKGGETVVSTGVFKLRNGLAVVIDNSLNPEFQLQPHPANQ
jgi:membrane fusion protein (multidrug efflux system)